jgi:hypothetical protein
VEDLGEFYQELLATYTSKRSTKADKVRDFITNLSAYMSESRLCLDIVYVMITDRVLDINRGYFTRIVHLTWNTEMVDGVEWIRVDQPKGRWKNDTT